MVKTTDKEYLQSDSTVINTTRAKFFHQVKNVNNLVAVVKFNTKALLKWNEIQTNLCDAFLTY